MTKSRPDNPSDERPADLNKRDALVMDQWTRNAVPNRRGGAPSGNQNGKTRGIYVSGFLSDEEIPLYDSILERLHSDFVFNTSSDLMQVELVAVYFLRLARAQAVGDADAAERFDRMIRAHLRELKTTKLAREGDQPKKPDTSPAEWATAVLEKAKRQRKAATRKADKAAATSEEPKTEDSEPEKTQE